MYFQTISTHQHITAHNRCIFKPSARNPEDFSYGVSKIRHSRIHRLLFRTHPHILPIPPHKLYTLQIPKYFNRFKDNTAKYKYLWDVHHRHSHYLYILTTHHSSDLNHHQPGRVWPEMYAAHEHHSRKKYRVFIFRFFFCQFGRLEFRFQ